MLHAQLLSKLVPHKLCCMHTSRANLSNNHYVPRTPPEPTCSTQAVCIAAGRGASRLSNLRAGSSSKALAPQGVTVADFPSGNELDAANGVVHEDAAIEISRKLVVDSLRVSACLLRLPLLSIPCPNPRLSRIALPVVHDGAFIGLNL